MRGAVWRTRLFGPAARRPRFFGPAARWSRRPAAAVAMLTVALVASLLAAVPVPGLGSSEARAQSAAPVGVVLSAWGGDAGGDVVEGAGGSAGYKFVVVSLSRVLGAGESVTVPLSVDGATVGVDYTLGLAPAAQAGVSLVSGAPYSAQDPAVLFAAGSSSATLRFSALDNSERSQPFVRIDTAAPSHSGLPGGLGAPTGGPIGFAIVDDETGDIELDSSALDPASADFAFAGARQAQTSERVAGSRYRLMIKTPAAITGSDGASVVAYPGTTATADADATTSRTDAYDTYMRLGIAQDYHDDNLLQPYSGFFKAFVSGASLDARDRVSLTSGGALQADIGVHMLGPGTLDGDKVADDFADLCDGSWDAEVTVSHRGADAGWDSGSGELAPWTGTLDDCTASAGPLGHATAVTHGGDETDPLDSATAAPAGERPLYAMITVNLRRTVRSVTLSVDDAVVDEGDGATTITVTATVDGRYVFDEDKTVSVAVAGSGDAGAVGFTTDKADDSFDIIIPAMAESATGTFTLTPTDDTDLESDETITVSGTITPMTANDEFHSGFTLNPASITLTDDDGGGAPVTVSWSRADDSAVTGSTPIIEGQSHVFKVSLGGGATGPVTIPLGFTHVTTAAADVTVPAGVDIPAGASSATFEVVAEVDALLEVNQLGTLTLCPAATCPDGYTAGDSEVKTDVLVSDPGVELDLSELAGAGTNRNMAEGGAASFTARLRIDPTVAATVTVKAVDGDQRLTDIIAGTASTLIEVDTDPDTPGAQNTLTFTPGDSGNWAQPQTVTLEALYDGDAAANDEYSVGLITSAASGPYQAAVNTSHIRLTVNDAGHAVVVEPGEVTVSVPGTASYGLRLASDPGGTVTVTPASGDTAKATVTGEAKTFDTSTWRTPQQVTVTGVGGAGTATTVTHSVTTGTTDYPTTMTNLPSVDVNLVGSATIDVAMAVSGGDGDNNAVENAGDSTEYVTVTLTLGRALTGTETLTVPLTVRGATVADDYTFALQPTSQTGVSLTTTGGTHTAQDPAVEFASGASSATLRLTAVNNEDPTQPYVVIDFGGGAAAPSGGGGASAGTLSGNPIGLVLVDDEMGGIEVAADWALKPSGVAAGEKFRLIFITSETRNAVPTDIEVYNDWVQGVVARNGHAELKPYGGLVKVIGSTASTDARENTGMWSGSAYADGSTSASDSGTAIYWLAAPPTDKVADNYFDFYDGSWNGGYDQSQEDTTESGASRTATGTFHSGSDEGGIAHSADGELGASSVVRGSANAVNGTVPLNDAFGTPNTTALALMAMSPVFKVEESAAPVVSVELVAVEGARTPTGEVAFGEGEGGITPINFPITADPAPAANLTVCVQVAETGHGGADRVASSAEGIHTATITTSGSVEHMVAYSNTAVDEPDSIVTLTVLAPEAVGCSAADGSYTVSTTNPSDKARIEDDEATITELTSDDTIMVEGIPAGTAEVTVSLARRLYDGEVMEIELRLSTDTGAVLPHVASPDFTVSSATGNGVALSDATTAAVPPDGAQTAPKITFTGNNTNTVQTATVTFAPTAGRDPDSDDETITVSLAPSITLVGATGTNVGGGATRHASNYMVDLTLAEAVAVSVTELRVAENGGAATYEVRLLTAPVGGNTTVTVGKVNGTGVNPDTTAATLTDKDGNVVSTLTFTPTNFSDAQVITVTGVDELSVFDMATDSPTYRDRTLTLTHTAAGGGYSGASANLGDVAVTVQEAPQIEVYTGRISTAETPGPYRNGLPVRHTLGVALQTDVFSTMDFFVRASDRPVGGPITVTLTVAPTYKQEDLSGVPVRSNAKGPLNTHNGSIIGMQLTRSSPVVQTLTLTFHDRPVGPRGCGIVFNDDGEMGDGTPDSSFACPRIVYLAKTSPVHGCQAIDVAVSGGSVRAGGDYSPESQTVHIWNGTSDGRVRDAGNGYKSACTWDSVVPRWSDPRPEPRTEYCVLGGRFVDPTVRSCFHFVDNLPSLDENSDTAWAPDGAQLVPEGSSTRYEIDLGAQVQRGQSYELELKPSGATMGDDYTLTLDADNSPHVSVDPSHPLTSAAPRLVFAPGARVASIVVAVADDGVHERELLTISYGEYRYKRTGRPDMVSHPKTRALFAFIDSTIPVPTTPVANLRVTADDAATATATWNRVLGATSYNITYQGNAVDPLNTVSGAIHGHTGTTVTFEHNAAEQMVITVTVTPVHRAADGTTTTYHALSSAADLDLANPTVTCTPDLPTDAVDIDEATRWRNGHSGDAHVLRWNRVLAALGEDNGVEALTFAESEANEGRFMASRWDRVTRTLEAIAQCDPPPPTPEVSIAAGGDVTEGAAATFTLTADPAPAAPLDVTVTVTAGGDHGATAGSRTVTIGTGGTGILTVATSDDGADEADGSVTATIADGAAYDVSATAGAATVAVADDDIPEISVAAGGDITEGAAATFTLTADPAPAAALDVTVAVTATGDYGTTAGSHTVTISTGGTGTLTVATSDDTADEPDGAVTATVSAGQGYTVSATAGAATVAVADDDPPPPACTPDLPADAVGVNEVTAWRDGHSGDAHVLRWDRVLAALGEDNGETPMTVTESQANENTFMASRWDRVTRTLEAHAQCDSGGTTTTTTVPPPPPPATPEVSVTADGDITEGGTATFTLTAAPAPTSALTVTVSVSQTGDYGAATGARTVTIATSGTATLAVTTADDNTDEADGTITATVDNGADYDVSVTAGTATVAVSDDDDPPPPPPPPPTTPEVSITADGDITEGGTATFTLTADPAPTSALTVTVSVSQTGDYGTTPGARQVTIPTGGTATLAVTTADDNTDEADGTITATIDDGADYDVSVTAGAATVAVSDDDDPPPPPPPPQTRLDPSQVSFSVDDATGTEGDTVRIRVSLSDPANKKVRVWWSTRYHFDGDHAAFPGRDHPQRRGWLTFDPGDTETHIEIPLTDDTATEPGETFLIHLGFVEGGASIADREATITIGDND